MTDTPNPEQPPDRRFRKNVNWLGVEADYRAGALPLKVIGSKYGISHTAVMKRAKKHGWIRDLAGVVGKVAKERVARQLQPGFQDGNLDDIGNRTPSEHAVFRETIEVTAEAMIKLVRQHQATLKRDHAIVQELVDKVESLVPGLQTIEQVERGIEIMETITRIRARVIPLERQSFNLDPRKVDDPARGSGDDDSGADAAADLFGALEKVAAGHAGGYTRPPAVAERSPAGADHPAE